MKLLIHDGLTLDGTVAAMPPFPAVAYRYRPALPEDVYEFLSACPGTGKNRLAATVGLLAKCLLSWDVTDDQDATVPVTPAALARVPQPYLDAMLDAVTGYAGARREDDAKN